MGSGRRAPAAAEISGVFAAPDSPLLRTKAQGSASGSRLRTTADDVERAAGNVVYLTASRDEDGRSSVYLAALACNAKAIDGLLRLGAPADTPVPGGGTALMISAYSGYAECVAALLEGGADADLADDRGFTALISAVLQGRVDCARLLVEAGADGSRQDNNGKTALEWAEQLGHTKIAELLQYQPKKPEPEPEPEPEQQPEIVRLRSELEGARAELQARRKSAREAHAQSRALRKERDELRHSLDENQRHDLLRVELVALTEKLGLAWESPAGPVVRRGQEKTEASVEEEFDKERAYIDGFVEANPDYKHVHRSDLTAARIYTRDEIYDNFNRGMRETTAPDSPADEWKSMYYHLRNAVREVKGVPGGSKLFRGQPEFYGDDEEAEKRGDEPYKLGASVRWKDFKSTTTDRSVAVDSFATDGGVLFEIDTPATMDNFGADFCTAAPNVGAISVYPAEGEILLPPGVTFLVTDRRMEGQLTVVGLKYKGEWADLAAKEPEEDVVDLAVDEARVLQLEAQLQALRAEVRNLTHFECPRRQRTSKEMPVSCVTGGGSREAGGGAADAPC